MDAERIIELRARIAALERELADYKRRLFIATETLTVRTEIQHEALSKMTASRNSADFTAEERWESIVRLRTERDEAHAAIRWLMARFHPYVNVPIEHAPAIRRVMGEKG